MRAQLRAGFARAPCRLAFACEGDRTALLTGGALMGIAAALLALPAAAAIVMLVKELRVAMPGELVDDGEVRQRELLRNIPRQLARSAWLLDAAPRNASTPGSITSVVANIAWRNACSLGRLTRRSDASRV